MKFYYLFVFLFLVGCQSGSSNKVSKKGDSTNVIKSSYSTTASTKLRPFSQVILNNGLKVYFIEDASLPLVSVQLLVKTGQINEEIPGVNAMTAQLLSKGTAHKNALQLSDELAHLATDFDVTAAEDFTVFKMDSLAHMSDSMLNLFYEIMSSPKFDNSEIVRLRKQYLAQLQQLPDNPSAYADHQAEKYFFASHPYGRLSIGDSESLAKLGKKQIIQHYLNYYRPNNSILIISGQFSADFKSKTAELFSQWSSRPVKSVLPNPMGPTEGIQLQWVAQPGLKQAQLRFLQLGVSRSDEDFLKLRLINSVLGGDFVSRLNQAVRDQKGLTYSIYSNFAARLQPGDFTISTFTKNESVSEVVKITLKVLESFIQQGLTESELRSAKSQLLGNFPRAIETSSSFAYNLMLLDFYGIHFDYLRNFEKEVKKISLSDVNQILRQKLSANNLKILIYGDPSALRPDLKVFNPQVISTKGQ